MKDTPIPKGQPPFLTMNLTQLVLPNTVERSLYSELWNYRALFPDEKAQEIGDRLRYKLGVTTARKCLVPAEIPDDSDEFEFPLDIIYVPENEEVVKVVTTINNLLESLAGQKLQYLQAYFDIIQDITAQIPGAM